MRRPSTALEATRGNVARLVREIVYVIVLPI